MKTILTWVKGLPTRFMVLGLLVQSLALVARREGLKAAYDQAGSISPARTITLLIMAFVVVMFILSFVPELEDAIGASTITDPFVSAILPMLVWIIPIGAILAIIIAIFKQTGGKG